MGYKGAVLLNAFKETKMTRALSSYPPSERPRVVARRLKAQTGGLGFLAAADYKDKKIQPLPTDEYGELENTIEEARDPQR